MTLVELKNINKVYGKGLSATKALNEINFSADQGELITITGPSGSGKSTFLKLIGGILQPTSGDISIDNVSYQNLSRHKKERFRLNKIGFILQAYNLLPFLKVKEQFELIDRTKKSGNLNPDQFQKIVKLLDIQDLMNHYPDELSGGQQQRIAIAKALYANPKIILADEPTAALDGKKAVEVMKIFQQLAHRENKLVLLITHDSRLVQYADRNYQIVDGHGDFISIKETQLV